MATAAAAAVAVARRKVLSHFFAANAVSPENATRFEAPRRLQQRQFDQMRDKGVIREAKPGYYYVDVPAWDAWHQGLHTRAKIAIVLVLLVMAGVLIATVGRG